MSYKLKINRAPLTAPKKIMIGTWESPVGWWKVTTEGDVEGRSIDNLGTHYGHVAEIAFHLADKCSYALRFIRGTPNGPAVRRVYNATRAKTRVNFNNEQNIAKIAQWMDTSEVKVKSCTYYGTVELELVG